MCKIIQRLLSLFKGTPKKKQRKNDGLSAEKNIVQTIQRKTGASTREIRDALFDGKNDWRVYRRKNDKQCYYDQEARKKMIEYAFDVIVWGYPKCEN